MAEHAFFSLVSSMLRGHSDSVYSVTIQKFAVRTKQRVLRGQVRAVHPDGESKRALSEFDVVPLPYMHLPLCPRRPIFGQDRCCSKHLPPWWSAPAVRAPPQEEFWALPELNSARRCSSDFSSAFPHSVSWHAHLTIVIFLSIWVNNYCYSYSYSRFCPANAPAKKCSSLLKGFFLSVRVKLRWLLNLSFQKSFANLPMAFTDEFDWPQFSEITGFLNSTIG